jgi:hypothetical protein
MRASPGAILAVLLCVSVVPLSAHDIPADVTIKIFVKPDGHLLHYLVRMPMASINDIDWPLRKNDGTLDQPRLESPLHDAATLWIGDYTEIYEGRTKLAYPDVTAVRLSVEGDTSFESFDAALAHVTGPRLPEDSKLLPTQGMLDVLFDYHIQSDQAKFSIRPKLDRLGLRVTTILRFLPPVGGARLFEYQGGDPGLLRLDPQWYQAAWQFGQQGFFHVLDSTDLLLLLFCLVIPFRRAREIVPVVAAFVVAQAVTLLASAYNIGSNALWFQPLITTLVAASILYVAVENIFGARLERRSPIAYAFGLASGFAVAFPLQKTLQFAGSHSLMSIVSFNGGILIGELFTLALMVSALEFFFQFLVEERMGTMVLSAFAAHSAWHWSVDRYDQLRKFPVGWPVIDALFLASVMRWLMVLVLLAAGVWLIGVMRPNQSFPASTR